MTKPAIPDLTTARDTVAVSPPAKAQLAASASMRTDHLTGPQKAAIMVRFLLSEGMEVPLAALPSDMQARLTENLGSLRLIDRATLLAVIAEFSEMLEQVGMSFPNGLDGALALLEGRLHEDAARQLRALARGSANGDCWQIIATADDAELVALLQAESVPVGAVVLSKLPIEKAAALLACLSPVTAQNLALAVSRTAGIDPAAVDRIGAALAQQLAARPPQAFSTPPTKRVGDILNSAPTDLRETLLAGLRDQDKEFAEAVRQSIFTFQDIPQRLAARDVPSVIKTIAPDDLVMVLAANAPDDQETIDFLLSNISKRMAETLRDDASALPPPSASQHETATSSIMAQIRTLLDNGTISLQAPTGAN